MNTENRGTILIVDDEPNLLQTISILLKKNGYMPFVAMSAGEAIEQLKENSFDAVMADIRMPETSGLELLDRIRGFNPEIPVILMTAFADFYAAVDAIKLKAFDFILKPHENKHILHSVEKAVNYHKLILTEKNYKIHLEETVRDKTEKLKQALGTLRNTSREMMQRLATVSEYRDTDTGAHIQRIGLYSEKIAEKIDMPADFIRTIKFASTLHDIGKVGIPDSVLLKPGNLTQEEFEIITTHTSIGEKMLAGSFYPGMQMAASIALTHHEKWDGSGYPQQLKGNAIPLEGRIVFICDRYDAIRSKRPYKPPVDHKRAVTMITEGNANSKPEHFDPFLLETFISVAGDFESIYEKYQKRTII
ncbi:MAG: response regulator [Deltaproteobacteria bacterium]|nr:response regulator [Deltaproteobacteria bacterium]NIS77243.1 response regulator [Deltaproteobacteria bacterium]